MAQHDYNLANQSGADFRADLNNALSAIATVNSGASEPSTTFAHQLWVDTSNNLLKIRNAANSAFITTGISITADNVFTGALTGNASTATTLATARTINGTSFDGSANISFNTDSVAEGSSNLYFTNERVDDQVNALLQAGTGIQLTYDDTAGTLTIANTNDADITGVVAGNALTGGGTSGSVTLNVAVDDSSIEIDSDALRVKASGITNTMLAGSIANSKLVNSGVTINSQSLSLGGTLVLDTDNIGEGSSNLYYTDARARAAISENSAQLSYNSTTGVLTYTQGDTDTVSEGSNNLYYTQARFDTAFGNKTTANLTENTNLYYTDTRANSAIDARVTNTFINNLSGVVADTSTALATARTIALSGDVVGSVSFDGTADVTIASTIQANSVALGTDTTGNYIQTITGTANKITVSGSGSESADVTLTLPDNVQVANDLTVAGNLTVNGTLTSLDTTNLDIEDNLFQLNAGLTGSPVNDSGMLINRGNQNNGIFMWDESVDKFTLGLTTADGTSTGNITLASLGTLVANVEGNVTGTIQTAAQPNITSLGTLTGLTTTGDINFGDSDKAVFGASSDLQIYHDGSTSYILDDGTGDLQLRTNNRIVLAKSPFEYMADFNADGAVDLYYDNSKKLATTSTGIDVTGNATFDDNGKAIFGAGSDLQIYHDGSNSYIKDAGTGTLRILSDDVRIMNAAGTEISAQFLQDGEARLKYDNSTKLATTSTGVNVTGTVTNDGLRVDNTDSIRPTTDTSLITLSGGNATNSGANYTAFGGTHATLPNIHRWRIGGSEAGRFDSSGQLLIGKTASDNTTVGTRINGSGFISSVVDGDNAVLLNRLNSDGSIVLFRKDGTSVGAINTVSDDLAILSSISGHKGLRFGAGAITPTTNTAAIDNGNTDLGGNSIRFKDLYLAGTANVNKVSIQEGSSGGSANANADGLVIDNNGKTGITILTPNDSEGLIFFADPDDDNIGRITYNHSTNAMGFVTNNSTAITVDSSQRVGISTTSPAAPLHLGAASPHIDLGLATGNRGKVGYDSNNVYIGSTSGTGEIHFKNNISSGDAPHSSGDTKMVITDSGVGIGTTSPDVFSRGYSGTTVGISSASGETALQINSSGTNVAALEIGRAGSRETLIYDTSTTTELGSLTSKPVIFLTGGAEKSRIDTSGNLLIGSTSFNTGAFGATKGINVAHTQPIVLLHETDTDKDCYIGMSSSQMFIGTADAIPIRFHTSDAEKMRLLSNGSFCIGGTAIQAVNSVSFAKETNGITFDNNTASSAGNGHEYQTFRRNSSQIGGITMNGTTGVSYNTSSDARLKDVTGEARGLEVINELNPVAYNWKADGKADEGLIAQEVLDIVPNAVVGSEEEMYQMDYSKLVVHLVAGMKEQQTQIEELKQQIQNLTGE